MADRNAWACVLAALLCAPWCSKGSILGDSSYGYRLPSPPEVAVWWCEATWKVGRERALPQATNTAVQIEAARNEYEPFQLVLRPQVTLSNVTVSAGNLVRQGGPPNATISATNIQVCLVEYVPVAEASDEFGAPGWYPDPLFPLSGPVTLAAQTNQPFWITVYVPKDTPAGLYTGTITVNVGWAIPVPIRLRVYDFTLPDVTHTRSAFYVSLETQWHGPLTTQQKNQLWDIYMENFRRHRVCPYTPHINAPITWMYLDGDFVVDFSNFDTAMKKYLDEFGFNSYNLMGYKSLPFPLFLAGHWAFSPGYKELFRKLMAKITGHLREMSWLEHAYCYWMDEPSPNQLDYLLAGMETIRNCAPGLKSLVTINIFPPPSQLLGSTDILAPLVHRTDHENYIFQQYIGDEIWGYLCMRPIFPSPNFFIDHPAVNHRIVFWYAENRSISGLLYWGVNYWPTNVWQMPKAREDVPNGDGLLWYPPVRSLPTNPVVTPPINSLRWELIREGLEDKEYFWLLKQAITNAMKVLGSNAPQVRQAINVYTGAVGLASSLSNLTSYSRDLLRLQTARQQMADAIELLDNGAPFFVRQPKSRAIALGETVTLYSEALGWPQPSYVWFFDGTPVAGATNMWLTLTNVSPATAGTYYVAASNALGSATSAPVKLVGRWELNPQIVSEPADLVRYEGGTAVFSVTAVSALPMTYTWFFNGAVLATNSESAIAIPNVSTQHAGSYRAIISNSAGVVASRVATLTVLPVPVIFPPVIIRAPTNQVVPPGSNMTMTVAAKGPSPLRYQWYFNLTNLLQGYTNETLLITNVQELHAGMYSVVVTNPAGAATSAPAVLTVLPYVTNVALIPTGAVWRYLYPTTNLGTAWRQPQFNDSSWPTGPAPLGYGKGNEATILAPPSPTNPVTAYFRRSFIVPEEAPIVPLTARIRRDDGVVVYLNGSEVFRDNLPTGQVTHTTSALVHVVGNDEAQFVSFTIPTNLVRVGTNILAIEVHQCTNPIAKTLEPIAWWHLEESNAPWRDAVGTNHFSKIGTDIVTVPGVFGNAVSNRASSTSWLSAADTPQLRYSGPFTVGGWFAFGMQTGNDPATTCLEKQGEFRLYYAGTAINRYRFQVGQTEVQDQTSGTKSGQWRFVVGWFDGSNACIQVDNGAIYSVAASPPAPTVNPLVTLKRAGTTGGFAADEVFFFKRVLSASERTAIYIGNFSATNVPDLAFDLELTWPKPLLPRIISQPKSIVRCPGMRAVFEVTAQSHAPVTYQWYFNGDVIPWATSNKLVIEPVEYDHAGDYSVVVGNFVGPTSSDTATLAVVPPPELSVELGPDLHNSMFKFTGVNVAAQLLGSSNLVDWFVLCNLPATSNDVFIIDLTFSREPCMFYRLRPVAAEEIRNLPPITSTEHFRLWSTVPPNSSTFAVYFNATNTAVCFQSSTNLTDWQTLHCLPKLSGLITLLEPLAPADSCRFYRLIRSD